MSEIMAVLLNGVAQLEYDRTKQLTDYQLTYLHNMDKKMNEGGVEIAGELITSPDDNQKAQFVVANLLVAMRADDASLTSALCTYLAQNMPDLKQIKIDENGGEVTVDFVFDDDYKGQSAVEFGIH